MESKKGTVLLWITIFGIIAAFGIFFALTAKIRQPETQYTGEQGLKLINKYGEAENYLFYVDQAAKYAVNEALTELAKKGGYFSYSQGEYYLGYFVWNKKSIPDYKNNLKLEIDNRLNPYFNKVLYNNSIPKKNYNYVILDDGIAGIAKKDLAFYTPLPGRIEYYVKPSFNVKIKHDLEVYDSLSYNVYSLIDYCETSENLSKCVEENKQDDWNLNYCDVFSKEEKDCLIQPGKVSFFADGKFDYCGNCPSDAECNNYIDERYCNLDPCGLGCTWNGASCKKTEEIKSLIQDNIFKFCKVVDGREYRFAVEFPKQSS